MLSAIPLTHNYAFLFNVQKKIVETLTAKAQNIFFIQILGDHDTTKYMWSFDFL